MMHTEDTQHLGTLCEIRSGYTARTKLSDAADGTPAIQLRDLRAEGSFALAKAQRVHLKGDLSRYEVRTGDIVFRSRGERNTAVVIHGTDPERAVVILPLIILRPGQRIFSPYLAWFINQPDTQRYFDSCARGTNMRMIPQACLEDLPVPLPSLEQQQGIVAIAGLADRERELLERLAEKKHAITNFALLNQARKAQPRCNGAGRSEAGRTRTPPGKGERTTR